MWINVCQQGGGKYYILTFSLLEIYELGLSCAKLSSGLGKLCKHQIPSLSGASDDLRAARAFLCAALAYMCAVSAYMLAALAFLVNNENKAYLSTAGVGA